MNLSGDIANLSQNKKGRQGLSTKKTVRSIQDAKDDILDLNKTAEVLETSPRFAMDNCNTVIILNVLYLRLTTDVIAPSPWKIHVEGWERANKS
ncbi:uncharacterized protein LOC123896824 isoform X2 [Trifolium pratense]|uniref:uncharacterized protein LOC123896824 isoform X2 n=1 Tax=Trifolium pratense TaxID=57577 RepID=UPI001E690433|nr:uncharacterized protein LOC123896824 isoform X2 [Trifolium pratense]